MRQKAEKVIHNVMIESFLRLYWFWGQKSRFLGLPKFAQDMVLAARFNFQN
jgi:hypothetical protein